MTLPVLHGCKGLSNNIKGKLLAFVCPVMFSFSGLFVKSIPWPWQYLLAIRGIIAGVTIYFFMQISQLRFTVNRSSLLIGITVFATNILYFPAQRLSSAAAVISLQSMSPAYLMLMCMVFYHTQYTFKDFALVLLSLIGMAFIFLDANSFTMLGNLFAILSGIANAGTQCSLASHNLEERYSGIAIGHSLLLVCLLMVSPVSCSIFTISPAIIIAVLFAGIIQIPVPNLALSKAAGLTSPLAVSLICTFEIFLNPLWVFLFLGELPAPLTLIGSVVILVSVVLWTVFDSKNPLPKTQAQHSIQ